MINPRKKQDETPGGAARPEKVSFASRWGGRKTWVSIILLFFALEAAVFSIEQAHWITPQPSLTLVLVLSIVTVRLLTVTRLPGWAVHVLAVITGFLVTVWQGISLIPGASGVGRLITIFRAWLQGGAGLEAGEDKAVFGVILVLLVWLAGYISTWFLLRRNNPWLTVSLGITVIIVNFSNITEKGYLFFTLFALAAVLLIVQTRVVRQHSQAGRGKGYSGKSLFYLVVSLFCITILAVSVSWFVPQLRLPSLQNSIAAALPWKSSLQESGFNILNSVPSKKSVSTAARLQDLTFGRYWHVSDDIKFTVISPLPAYWQVNVYDIYTSGSWVSSPSVEEPMESRKDWGNTGIYQGQERIKYEVITGINTDALLLTGEFSSAEIPVLVSTDIESEVTAVRAPRLLAPGERYTIRSYVSGATAGQLSAAGDDYSQAVRDVYLQLPAGLPAEIRAMAANVTREAETPYDKVVAVDDYLSSNFTYSREVDELPEGGDAVADFLFTQERGFCIHFASAMAVMLRSIDVPARLVVGYLPGDPGKEKGEYLLRDKHYHAWTQVYFPGYGWINFEPTPSSTEGQVRIESPLVSTPEIRDSTVWDAWFYPPGFPQNLPVETGAPPPEPRSPVSNRFAYGGELGIAVLIIAGAALVFGLLFGLSRIVKPVFSDWIWDIDRERLASYAYGNLCRLAAAVRIEPGPQETPLEFSARLAELIPEQSRELDYIVRAYLAKRFGPQKGKPDLYEEAEILKARVIVYNAILRRTGKVQKFIGARE